MPGPCSTPNTPGPAKQQRRARLRRILIPALVSALAQIAVLSIGILYLHSKPEPKPKPKSVVVKHEAGEDLAGPVDRSTPEGAYRAARRDGQVAEDPERARLRRAVLDAFFALSKTRDCDAALQEAFAQATIAFLRERAIAWSGPPIESVALANGRQADIRALLDRSAIKAIRFAVRVGHLRHLRRDALPNDIGDLPEEVAAAKQPARNLFCRG
jgi:hypothetical protein